MPIDTLTFFCQNQIYLYTAKFTLSKSRKTYRYIVAILTDYNSLIGEYQQNLLSERLTKVADIK